MKMKMSSRRESIMSRQALGNAHGLDKDQSQKRQRYWKEQYNARELAEDMKSKKIRSGKITRSRKFSWDSWNAEMRQRRDVAPRKKGTPVLPIPHHQNAQADDELQKKESKRKKKIGNKSADEVSKMEQT